MKKSCMQISARCKMVIFHGIMSMTPYGVSLRIYQTWLEKAETPAGEERRTDLQGGAASEVRVDPIQFHITASNSNKYLRSPHL